MPFRPEPSVREGDAVSPVQAKAWQLLKSMAYLIKASQWSTRGREERLCPLCSNFPEGEQDGLGSGHAPFCDYSIILAKLVEVGL